jgi:hypothetical protein
MSKGGDATGNLVFYMVLKYALGALLVFLIIYIIFAVVMGSFNPFGDFAKSQAGKELGRAANAALSNTADVIELVGDGIKTAAGTVPRPSKPLKCAPDEVNRAGLCYKKCKSDEDSDGTEICYKKMPSNYSGKQGTLFHLQHDTYYSPLGIRNTSPICGSSYISKHGECYKKSDIPSDWELVSKGKIGQKCHKVLAHSTPQGNSKCRVPRYTLGRGAGFAGLSKGRMERCEKEWGKGKCEHTGAIAYPKCSEVAKKEKLKGTFVRESSNICVRKEVSKNRPLKDITGHKKNSCSTGREKVGAFCYAKCTARCRDNKCSGGKKPWEYHRTAGNLEFCTSKCPVGFKDIGIGGCERPGRKIGMGKPPGWCPTGYEKSDTMFSCFQKCDDIPAVKNRKSENPKLKFKAQAGFCFPLV